MAVHLKTLNLHQLTKFTAFTQKTKDLTKKCSYF